MTFGHTFARLALHTSVLAFAPAAHAEPAPVPENVVHAADTYITRAALEGPIRFLSSDLLEGRGPGTRGDELARLYLQTQLESMGYQPAFQNGAWQQPVVLVGIKSLIPATWSFEAKERRVDLKLTDDYSAASGLQSDRVTVPDSELVFVGYGIQAREYRWDDFKGANLAGKILVMLNNNPDWDPNLSPVSDVSTTGDGLTSTRAPPGSAQWARSSSTPRHPPAIRGRLSRTPASISSSPPATSPACD